MTSINTADRLRFLFVAQHSWMLWTGRFSAERQQPGRTCATGLLPWVELAG
jgi:hypothetical protein